MNRQFASVYIWSLNILLECQHVQKTFWKDLFYAMGKTKRKK